MRGLFYSEGHPPSLRSPSGGGGSLGAIRRPGQAGAPARGLNSPSKMCAT